MQAWYHCENTYPFVPQDVLDRADFSARQPAEQATAIRRSPPICFMNAWTSICCATTSA